MAEHSAVITITKPDYRFYVWFKNEPFIDHNATIITADLFKDQLDKDINVTEMTMYVYIWFEFYQPEAKFTLKLGDLVIVDDELASDYPMNSLPKTINTIELV
jgi:hypothetical protein